MRKILHLFAFASFAVGLFACNNSESVLTTGGSMPDPGPETTPEATLTLSQSEVTVGGSAFDRGEITLQSNQRVFSADCSESWVNAEIEGKILRAVAAEPNKTGNLRSATIAVTAGTSENTKTEVLTVHQGLWDESTEKPVLNLIAATAVLDAGAGAAATVGFETNKEQVTAVVAEGIDWLSAGIEDKNVVLKALKANETDKGREAVVTVTAGVATNSISATITVTQRVAVPEGLTIGAPYGGGMIFEVGEGESYVKIVSLTETKVVWSTANEDTGLPNTNADGFGNTAILQAMPDYDAGTYPAAKFCTDMGAGWYLPAREEMKAASDALKEIQTEVNTYLEALGGTALDFSAYYWVSNQHTTDITKAFTLRLRDKGAAAYAKSTTPRPTRAMKKIDLK